MIVTAFNKEIYCTCNDEAFCLPVSPRNKFGQQINTAPDKISYEKFFDIRKKNFLPFFKLLSVKISCNGEEKRNAYPRKNLRNGETYICAVISHRICMNNYDQDCAEITENIYRAISCF